MFILVGSLWSGGELFISDFPCVVDQRWEIILALLDTGDFSLETLIGFGRRL